MAILVTYVDLRTGDEQTEKFRSSAQMGIGESARRGMRNLYGKKWMKRYRIAHVTPIGDDQRPVDDDDNADNSGVSDADKQEFGGDDGSDEEE